jgi:hypothetical protein
MQLSYDEDFIEAAVFLCGHNAQPRVPALQLQRFHYEREKLYSILDPDERNAGFFKLHLEWFREWGLEDRLLQLLKEYPLLDKSLHLLAFRKVQSRRDEGAELYVQSGGQRTAVIALRVEQFQSGPALKSFLRHELMHLHDMVDPAFGYSSNLELPGSIQAQERLTRERYRTLWDVTIDGRLSLLDRAAPGAREHRWSEFSRGFSFWPEAKREQTFTTLWENDAPKHKELLAIAADPRDLSSTQAPLPGSSCPLCGFPTFRWAALEALDPECAGKIHAHFPSWTREQGACERCAEIYRGLSQFELPSTVVL